MSEHEAMQALQLMVDRLQPVQRVRRGLLGDSNGTVMVADRPGWAYIRYREGQLSIVRYLIPEQLPDGCPVVVDKRHPGDAYEQVLAVDWVMYATAPTESSVTQHDTPAIDLSDLSPGKVVPTDPASLSVDVRAFLYVNGDSAVEYGGGAIDLTANVPGVAGHRYVLVYMDLDTDSLAAENGDIVAVALTAAAPDVPESGLPLGIVDLENGEATITGDDIAQYKAMYLSVGTFTTFLALGDTPATYAGSGEYLVRVNAGEDALEFVAGGGNFLALDDTPASYVGSGGMAAVVNVAEDALEFATPGWVVERDALIPAGKDAFFVGPLRVVAGVTLTVNGDLYIL